MNRVIKFFLLILLLLFIVGCTTSAPIINNGKLQKFNESPSNCSEGLEGYIYYNNITKNIQICNGTEWSNI